MFCRQSVEIYQEVVGYAKQVGRGERWLTWLDGSSEHNRKSGTDNYDIAHGGGGCVGKRVGRVGGVRDISPFERVQNWTVAFS
jgi:hypothetical protein